jgi:hypothetical protein
MQEQTGNPKILKLLFDFIYKTKSPYKLSNHSLTVELIKLKFVKLRD